MILSQIKVTEIGYIPIFIKIQDKISNVFLKIKSE